MPIMYNLQDLLKDNRTTISDFLTEDKNYDTRKVTNRSSAVISEDIIQEIELQGVTLERLDELKVPVYKYITQVTLHGVFTGISVTSVGHYQNIILNQNQTLGVKYTAIDIPKKKIIGNALRYCADTEGFDRTYRFFLQTDSKGSIITMQKMVGRDKVQETYAAMKVIFDTIPDNFVGKKSIGTYSLLGIYIVAIIIDFKAIYTKNIFPFINSITMGIIPNEQVYNDKKYTYNEKKRLEDEERNERYRVEEEQRDLENAKHQVVVSAKIKNIASSMPIPVFEGSLPKGEFILAVIGMLSLKEERAGFKVYYVKKGGFGRMVYRTKDYDTYQEINLNPEFSYGDKSKVLEQSVQKNLEKYITKGKCYLLAPVQQVKSLHSLNKSVVVEKTESKAVTTSQSRNDVFVTAKPLEGGKLLIEVTGNHKPHKEFIKSQGVRAWDGENLRWWTKFGTPAQYEALVTYFNIQDSDSVPLIVSSPQKSEIKVVDSSQKLAEQWEKVAESCQKKSDTLNDNLRGKLTNTNKRQNEYNQARNTQENWEEIAKFQAAIAQAYLNKTAHPLLEKLKPMVGKEYYENSLYPFCKYRNSSPYGSQKNINFNFENRKPSNFNDDELQTLHKYLQEITGFKPIDPRKMELEGLIQQVKFGSISGFFPTPPTVIEKMIELANIQPNDAILEPSAGIGSIADEIIRQFPKESELMICIEQNYTLAKILTLKGLNALNEDFLSWKNETLNRFDKILMNPPFENGQDAEHIMAAYELLSPGGRIVAIAGEGIFFRNDKKSVAFREFLEEHGYSEKLPDDSFNGKDSFRKTGVATRLVVIDKEGENNNGTQSEPEKKEFDFEKFTSLAKTFNLFDRKNRDLDAQKIVAEMFYLMFRGYGNEDFLDTLNSGMALVENTAERAGIINMEFFMDCFIGYAKYEYRDKSKPSKPDDYCNFEVKYYLNKLSL